MLCPSKVQPIAFAVIRHTHSGQIIKHTLLKSMQSKTINPTVIIVMLIQLYEDLVDAVELHCIILRGMVSIEHPLTETILKMKQ